ncbi:hypothetical protein DH2020_036948 [Rehmannia glutinosa]|uniref:ABC transporter domain-containing protein n=1 Tax=Rehmannia glutinosa TaxID=99300 RepID=A0ABR0V4N6_REHGL
MYVSKIDRSDNLLISSGAWVSRFLISAFSKGKAAGYKLMEIIKQKPTIVQDESDMKCLDSVNGNIEFKNVTFSYPSRPDVIIFRDFSIFFPAGKTVAVVGGSGSGKSTVVSLIERFYDPNQGEILLDNVDIKTLQLRWLRNQIGLVNQEPALFATTILENILYGKVDATMVEIEAAAAAANAHSFITLLPNGYNTQRTGRRFREHCSGGFRSSHGWENYSSRSASPIDNKKRVDSIAVIQQGQVVETGTHEELISKAGAYASLIRFQEMVGTRELSTNPSTRRTRSSRLSHSLSTKSLSLRSGSLRNLSYSYSTGADGR